MKGVIASDPLLLALWLGDESCAYLDGVEKQRFLASELEKVGRKASCVDRFGVRLLMLPREVRDGVGVAKSCSN